MIPLVRGTWHLQRTARFGSICVLIVFQRRAVMLGNIVVYLFLAIILGLAVAWAVYAWLEYRLKQSPPTPSGVGLAVDRHPHDHGA